MSLNSYKSEQEAFVSNLTGTDITCILACVAHIPLLVLLLKIVQQTNKPMILRDILFLVVPLILVTTISANYNFWTVFLLAIYITALYRSYCGDTIDFSPLQFHNIEQRRNNTYFLTLFKGGLELLRLFLHSQHLYIQAPMSCSHA